MYGQVVEHATCLIGTVLIVFSKLHELFKIVLNFRIQLTGFLNAHGIIVATEALIFHFLHCGITDPVVLCNVAELDVQVVACEFVFGCVNCVASYAGSDLIICLG